MITEDFNYSYSGPSVIESTQNNKSVLFSHCTEVEENKNVPCFFYGNIVHSFIASKCLSTLAKTVASHFSLAPGQLALLKDPIISVGNQRLQFEAFSSCNGVYARVDLLENGIDGDFLASGSTNVDFNDPTIRAFNLISKNEKLILGVGQKELHVVAGNSTTIEKKVSLPNRWIKGLGNVQLYLSQMELAFRMNQIQAIQLFQRLPKSPVKNDYFIVQQSGGFQFSPVAKGNSVRIGGVHRLRLMENLLPFVKEISVYKDPQEQSIAMLLYFDSVQMLFTFSANVFRGFSGEGKNLEDMTTSLPDEWIAGINNLCKTNEVFNPTLLAIESDISLSTMDNLKASLSSIGLLGYDLEMRQHFYRRLPFKLQRLKSLNPRLQNAKKLLDKDEVTILKKDQLRIEAEVKGTADVSHRVIIINGQPRCTCTWFTNHQTNRGLCKHILAVKIKLEL